MRHAMRSRMGRVAAACVAAASFAVLPSAAGATSIEVSSRNGEIVLRRNSNFYGQGFLHVVNPDGSAPRRMLRSGSISSAAWSPNGSRLAIAEQCVLRIVTASGKQVRQLTRLQRARGAASCDTAPEWSPDGKRLVFVRCPGACVWSSSALYIVNANGGAPRRLTQREGNSHLYDLQPIWSPDGTRVLFHRLDVGLPPLDPPYENWANNSWLYVINEDGSGLARLSSRFGLRGAAWSPDGTRIAFARLVFTKLPPNAVWTGSIGVMNADGSNERILVEEDQGGGRSCEGHGGWTVTWSPDGNKLAYSGPCPQGVYVTNPDGSDRVRVSRGLYDTVLDWRPLP